MQLQPVFVASKSLSAKKDREPVKSKAPALMFYSFLRKRLENSVGDCCGALVFALVDCMIID